LSALPVADLTGHVGAFGYDGDPNDYYSFTCAAGDIATLSLDYDETTSNVSLTLYNANQTVAYADLAGNSGTRGFSWGLHGGLCYVLVQGVNGRSEYSLDLSLDSPGYDEVEDNDSQPAANVLAAFPVTDWMGSLGLSGYDGDLTDYLTFTATDKQLYSFTMDYDETVSNFDLTLYNSLGQQVYADTNGNSGTRSFSWGLKAGNYFLRPNAPSGGGDYVLNISRTQETFSETEDNDSRPAAQVLPALPFSAFTGHTGQFGYDGDTDDYFFFNNADPGAQFSSDLTYASASGTLRFFLLDGAGVVLDSDQNLNPGTRHVDATIGPGTYYLRVQCTAGGAGYSCDASLTP
jgi:hypothetical protein